MCPLCVAASGLCVAGGFSAVGVKRFLATKSLRDRSETPVSTTTPQAKGDDHAATDDRIER